MANWLVILDADESRCAVYLERLKRHISPIDGLEVGDATGSGWGAAWSVASNAPFDVEAANNGCAVVWGEARDEQGGLQCAGSIREAWREGAPAQWDGFYSAAVIDELHRSLIVGTDILGIFPVYYWSDGQGLVLVGTSPELFRYHPSFSAELNLRGLVGILLTNGLIDGECLWQGVRRLGPGKRLRVSDGVVSEDIGYEAPTDNDAKDIPFRGHVLELRASLSAAIERHAPVGQRYGLMLSGGLDSRLLAGYLKLLDRDVRCLTYGQNQDIEMRCAKSVAKSLGFEHLTTEVSADAYVTAAERLARWEVLAAGFCAVPEWAMHDSISRSGDRVVMGHVFDGIVGGLHIGWAYESASRTMNFDNLMKKVSAWGMSPDKVKQLIGPENASLVDDVMTSIETQYQQSASREHHRAWLFDLQNRQRFHVGCSLWIASFAAWPVTPFLDRDVMAVCSSLPCSSLADRRAQMELLRVEFPELAQLPIDKNSYDMMPIDPRLRDFLLRSIRYRTDSFKTFTKKILGQAEQEERIYYHRLYDFNSPGWLSVRKQAESNRNDITELLSASEVDSILPTPSTNFVSDNPIKDPNSARHLMGLCMIESIRRSALE